ncbi:MAG: cyclopropane fatty acyl phospholipid synthase [bacterium]|nr:cyclopropane fatty acyl phospholipid synthase [bacterium]
MTFSLKEKSQNILAEADIQINGNRPWDMVVHDERFYKRALFGGSLGLGESYMDGWWDVERLDEFFTKVFRMRLDRRISQTKRILQAIASILFNKQSLKRAFEVGERHYDIGNDLYTAMLDKRLTYTCGYWSGHPRASGLDEAQENKLDLVCRKLNLKKGQKILDIGCGWGSFAKYAAERYGVLVTGITISKEQAALARTLCTGLPVEIILEDYRKISGTFDHIVSLGMFEHVGYKNYRTYMKVASRHLKDGGLFLLHTIGGNETTLIGDPWFHKYIFPNGMFPSIAQIGASIENLFVMEDWHNFGADYDKTLMAWFANFDAAWPRLKSKYGDRFYRMWKYYLLCVAGSFRARDSQLWQIVLSKNGVDGGYQTVR